MVRCPRCSAELPAYARFCSACGSATDFSMAARESLVDLDRRRARREKAKRIFLWAAAVTLSISGVGYFAVGRLKAEQARQGAVSRLAASRAPAPAR
jgi:cytochrome c-type biogenesis protein CcmH/NrfG